MKPRSSPSRVAAAFQRAGSHAQAVLARQVLQDFTVKQHDINLEQLKPVLIEVMKEMSSRAARWCRC
jgi:hypothetical protein